MSATRHDGALYHSTLPSLCLCCCCVVCFSSSVCKHRCWGTHLGVLAPCFDVRSHLPRIPPSPVTAPLLLTFNCQHALLVLHPPAWCAMCALLPLHRTRFCYVRVVVPCLRVLRFELASQPVVQFWRPVNARELF